VTDPVDPDDPVDPVDPLDLEASTALDDDRSGDDSGSRSPELDQRIEAFARVRAAVGAPVDPPSAEAREAAVAAALGAFDAHDATGRDPGAQGVAVVTPLRRGRPGGRWIGAAAAVAALVLGAAAVLTGGFGGTDEDETAATATADEATELDAADADAEVRAPAAAPEAFLDDADADADMTFGDSAAGDGAGGPVELGAHDDVEGLVRSLAGPVEEAQRSSLPTTTAAQGLAGDAAGDACDDTRSALAAEGPLVLEGNALVAGALVRVLVVDPRSTGDPGEPDTRREVVLADPGGVGCPVLERVPLG
jgi:hypothetical protein